MSDFELIDELKNSIHGLQPPSYDMSNYVSFSLTLFKLNRTQGNLLPPNQFEKDIMLYLH